MAISLAAVAQTAQVRVGWRTNVPPAWDFDVAAIAAAARELGVTRPIVIGCTEARRGRFSGLYMPEPNGHRISVWRRASAPEASSVIWHELEHAAQEERGDYPDTGTGTYATRGDAYWNDPAEIGARRIEALHGHRPLVR
jgi:hypothetical protein